MRLPINQLSIPVVTLFCAALAACVAAGGGETAAVAAPPPVNGPAADYPVVLGEPFLVDGVLYTPRDTLNYDEVGYAGVDPDANGVTTSHRTLPMPSYVEVTSLQSGQTILVRVERRGPMTGSRLIALSPAALVQLGIAEGAPVRVRRVNPPESDRAKLRAGGEAPDRMATPQGLLAVLRSKLPETGSASLRSNDPRNDNEYRPGSAPAKQIAEPVKAVDTPMTEVDPDYTAPPPPPPAPPPPPGNADVSYGSKASSGPTKPPPQPAVEGNFVVQAAAFLSHSSAQQLADRLEGFVEQSGKFWRVRTGPFATRGQAEASLAKVRAAGYSDAVIYTLD